MKLQELQRLCGEWAIETFPGSTLDSTVAHLRNEVNTELAENPSDSREAADCLLLLLSLAHRSGYDLMEAAQAKFEINKKRQWGARNLEGFQEHIKTSPSPENSKCQNRGGGEVKEFIRHQFRSMQRAPFLEAMIYGFATGNVLLSPVCAVLATMRGEVIGVTLYTLMFVVNGLVLVAITKQWSKKAGPRLGGGQG